MTAVATPSVLKPSDFGNEQEVRWCPGCGDYAVLANVKKALAKMGVPKHNTVFVSGIGCSSRFPYYLSTYGFHSIHGRAPTLATGLKLARPELNVWVITGDGDALSIGGNHFLHLMRRNMDLKILLFNNRIYGLTKGQYSPTSEKGKKTKSSPVGSPEDPIRPISVAIGAEATFAARAIDVDMKHLEYVLDRAAHHKGTAFVEIYQNCVIFNNGAYEYASDKLTKAEHTLYLEHGKPMVFGKDNERGIRMNGTKPQVVRRQDVSPSDLLVHDEKAEEPTLAFLLSRMRHPDFPEPLGVFRDVERACYNDAVYQQIDQAVTQKGEGDLQELLRGDESWTVQ